MSRNWNRCLAASPILHDPGRYLVWIDHLRAGDAELAALLNGSQVLMHPFVLGELACGNVRNRTEVLALLKD